MSDLETLDLEEEELDEDTVDENWLFAGPVSSGTMREEDLIPAFIDQLDAMGEHDQAREFQEEWGRLKTVQDWFDEQYRYEELRQMGAYNHLQDQISWLLNEELFDALDSLAANGYYFASHPGDGACFGFWIYEDY